MTTWTTVATTPDERADLAESMVPLACDLACRVRDGDAEGIERLAGAHGWDAETAALLVVLAAMVPVDDATPNQLLEWTGGLEAVMAWRQEPLPATGYQGRELKPCGTHAAYARHKRNDEPVDDACDRAEKAYRAERLRERGERARRAAAGDAGQRGDEAEASRAAA